MVGEVLPLATSIVLPLLGISLKIKQNIRQHHPQYGQCRIEVCHVEPRFAGGTSERSNLVPQTLPEHALQHLDDAVNSNDWEIAKANYWATHKIVERMTQGEFTNFNEMMKSRKKG